MHYTLRSMQKLLRALMALGCLGCLALLVFAVSWRSPTMAGLTATSALALAPLGLQRRWLWGLRVPLALVTLGLIPTLLGQTIDELNATSGAIQARYLSGGAAAVPLFDKLAVYQLGLWMVALGAPLVPEVALEHGLMMLPGPDTRTFESDFPMRSAYISAWMTQFEQSLRAGGPAEASRRFTWTYSDPSEARVALALNPFDLTLTAADGGRRIEAAGEVKISYPAPYDLPLLPWDGRIFVVRERLFGLLEDAGWYHPYTAVWRWQTGAQ